jgi:hypothetical protein
MVRDSKRDPALGQSYKSRLLVWRVSITIALTIAVRFVGPCFHLENLTAVTLLQNRTR